MKTKTITLYEYSELSPKAKKKALDTWNETNDDPFMQSHMINLLKEKLDERGIKYDVDSIDVRYSLSYCQRYGFTATARWAEYYPGAKMGFQWHVRPFLMLGKCAEALALRKAFPKLLSGMYAQEEMDKTSQVESDSQRSQRGLQTLLGAIKTASKPELEEYSQKMAKSEKYTDAQKAEYQDVVNKRIIELEQTA